MNKVTRSEVLPYPEYDKKRETLRPQWMKIKEARRIHLGPHSTFLFENHETVLYQIQEMVRVEKMQGEPEIQHEVDTYNELLGEPGELGCTLLIEIDDEALRAQYLSAWKGLPEALYIQTHKGQKVYAQLDERQVGETRISSVHYLKFKLGDQVPQKMGCDFPAYTHEVELTPAQTAALCQDLLGKT